MTEETDEELMCRYCSGHDDALGALYRRHRPALLAAMRRAASRSEAEDVVQETFLRVHRARSTFRRGELVRPWLWTIAYNVAKDLARRAARRPELVGLPVVPRTANDQTARPVERAESATLLGRALGALSPMLRETAVAHWLEERDFDEIARERGERAGTMRVRAHRACVRLRELLAPDLLAA
ncbi:MAG: RNA polymerase sigma factor [Deltaproteobacteria bacterium]|nr:RNA polymerase sigma factor [Deltaproteobacteria bacterium]